RPERSHRGRIPAQPRAPGAGTAAATTVPAARAMRRTIAFLQPFVSLTMLLLRDPNIAVRAGESLVAKACTISSRFGHAEEHPSVSGHMHATPGGILSPQCSLIR